MFNIIDEIDSVTMESELDVLLSMLSLYNKAMIISENYKSTEECDSLPFSIFQESSVIMESKSESIFKKLIRIIKETFKKIVESIKKIFKRSSKKEDIGKIKKNAKSAVEDYIKNKDKSKIAKLAAKIGLTVVAVSGGLVLLNKMKNKVIEIRERPKKSKGNNESDTDMDVNNESDTDIDVRMQFDMEVLKSLNDFIKNELTAPDDNSIAHKKHINAIKDITQTLQKLHESHKSSSEKTVDIETFVNDVDKIEEMYNDFDKVINNKPGTSEAVNTFTNETKAELNKFYIQFERYVSNTVDSVKALRTLSDSIKKNDSKNKYYEEMTVKIEDMLKKDMSTDKGDSTITVYPYLVTRNRNEDFTESIMPKIVADIPAGSLRKIARSNTKVRPGENPTEFVPAVGTITFNNEDYCLIVYEFTPILHADRFNITTKCDDEDKNVIMYFTDRFRRNIYAYSGYLVKWSDIKTNGIPIINNKMCFDIYMDYQEKHYYEKNHEQDTFSNPVTLKAIKQQ